MNLKSKIVGLFFAMALALIFVIPVYATQANDEVVEQYSPHVFPDWVAGALDFDEVLNAYVLCVESLEPYYQDFVESIISALMSFDLPQPMISHVPLFCDVCESLCCFFLEPYSVPPSIIREETAGFVFQNPIARPPSTISSGTFYRGYWFSGTLGRTSYFLISYNNGNFGWVATFRGQLWRNPF